MNHSKNLKKQDDLRLYPRVSVCVVTYNHESYIADCLKSVVEQSSKNIVEVIVADDCSKDGTGAIIENFRIRYPDLIKVISNIENIGPCKNYIKLHSSAIGDYIAHIDGDDLMLPNKIQEQVDYLMDNPDCTIIWHRMKFFNDNVEVNHPDVKSPFVNKRISSNELCYLGPFGPHSSTMYRRSNLNYEIFPDVFNDWFASVVYISNGYGIMLDSVLGAYRVGSQGISVGAKASYLNRELLIKSQREIIKIFPHLKGDVANRIFSNFILDLIKLRSYYILSYHEFISIGSVPSLLKIISIIRFYLWSKLPNIFNNNSKQNIN
jgi:glycosyltransferase involved in cell wall biosynthesis